MNLVGPLLSLRFMVGSWWKCRFRGNVYDKTDIIIAFKTLMLRPRGAFVLYYILCDVECIRIRSSLYVISILSYYTYYSKAARFCICITTHIFWVVKRNDTINLNHGQEIQNLISMARNKREKCILFVCDDVKGRGSAKSSTINSLHFESFKMKFAIFISYVPSLPSRALVYTP